ncbi:MAG: hypothetical protein JJE17_00885 [Peptostreptococcaceae bacterium]|nr:hypothetical protein [Peptostreptococcaceae bacterium]
MIDLREYVKQLEKEYKINDEQFSFQFSKLIVDNNWFGEVPKSNNGRFFVSDKFPERINSKVKDFCQYYISDVSDKVSYIEEKLKCSLPETYKIFKNYEKNTELDNAYKYQILDCILFYLAGEIHFADDTEIEYFMADICENLPKVYTDIIADFINWTNRHYKTVYKKVYFTNTRSSKTETSAAYEPNTYLGILYCMYNEDYIEENNMYELSSESKNYIDTWLFISLHFICALRNTDLFRLPHPKLTMKPEVVLKKVNDGTFSDDDARLTLYSIIWCLSTLTKTPNKTANVPNVPNIKFDVPQSVEVHIGKLFAIAEAHFQLKGESKEEPLIRSITSYEQISRYMGEEIGELFLEANFKSKSANKSYMQMIYSLTDDILENAGEFNVKGYILASLARSHKGSYGEFAQTTSIYLKDAKMSGYSPEFVAKELFERGVLSFVPSMLLKMITNGEYDKLSIENQTNAIKELHLTPKEVEWAIGFSQKTNKQAVMVTKEIFSTKSKDEIIKILHRIGNGNAVSKQGECLCLMTAMEKLCPFNERTSCPGCEYEISTKLTMLLLMSEYSRLAKLYVETSDELMKQKYKAMVNSVVLPSIDEMLQCVENEYGIEAFKSLERIVKGMENDK